MSVLVAPVAVSCRICFSRRVSRPANAVRRRGRWR
ncbi:hypothetical protein [Thalassolituus sp.]